MLEAANSAISATEGALRDASPESMSEAVSALVLGAEQLLAALTRATEQLYGVNRTSGDLIEAYCQTRKHTNEGLSTFNDAVGEAGCGSRAAQALQALGEAVTGCGSGLPDINTELGELGMHMHQALESARAVIGMLGSEEQQISTTVAANQTALEAIAEYRSSTGMN